MRHASEHQDEVYVHVPKSAGEDATVTISPAGGNRYTVTPFPFAGARLEARCQGRYFAPIAAGEAPGDLAAALYGLPRAEQVFVLAAD